MRRARAVSVRLARAVNVRGCRTQRFSSPSSAEGVKGLANSGGVGKKRDSYEPSRYDGSAKKKRKKRNSLANMRQEEDYNDIFGDD